MNKLTQDKASMLKKTGEIFEKANYLYSTEDKRNNPEIYRWNYFYVPMQIDGHDDLDGIRIAIRDMVRADESQIYHWGVKKKQGRPERQILLYRPTLITLNRIIL